MALLWSGHQGMISLLEHTRICVEYWVHSWKYWQASFTKRRQVGLIYCYMYHLPIHIYIYIYQYLLLYVVFKITVLKCKYFSNLWYLLRLSHFIEHKLLRCPPQKHLQNPKFITFKVFTLKYLLALQLQDRLRKTNLFVKVSVNAIIICCAIEGSFWDLLDTWITNAHVVKLYKSLSFTSLIVLFFLFSCRSFPKCSLSILNFLD